MCSRSKLLMVPLLQSRSDGSVVTWGPAYVGGDSSAVQEQLRDVQQIQASHGAFAAIRSDGSVVTWGDAFYGGDSSAVQEQLRDVQQIQACIGAFAAIRSDGSVVTWGHAGFGGDSSAVQEQLRNVQQIQASQVPLLQSGVMDLSSPGGQPTMVATAVLFRISCVMCSRRSRQKSEKQLVI